MCCNPSQADLILGTDAYFQSLLHLTKRFFTNVEKIILSGISSRRIKEVFVLVIVQKKSSLIFEFTLF